ncbi:hypothetical protein JVU11DRAFT_2542 [Chiua virens]|nr:hypothetical protein JVU11DRAFT_2542 [Chiua virens]
MPIPPFTAPVFQVASTFHTSTLQPCADKGKEVSFVVADDPPLDYEHSEHLPAPSDSLLTSLEEDLAESSKIQKSPGEAGRPGHGGYNLEEQLHWHEANFKKLKVSDPRRGDKDALLTKFQTLMHKLVRRYLDETKCRGAQDLAGIRTVKQEMSC